MDIRTLFVALFSILLLSSPPVVAGPGNTCILTVDGAPPTAVSSGGNTASQIVTLNCPDGTERIGEPRVTYAVNANGQGGTGVGGLGNAPPTVDYLGRNQAPDTSALPASIRTLLDVLESASPEIDSPGFPNIARGLGIENLEDLADLVLVGEGRWQDQWLVMVPNLSTYGITFCVDLDVDGDGVIDCDLCVSWGQWH
ncbi:MAG: hypothetical protein ACPGQL_03220 [Thermoplasmatota archaeon]